MEQEIMAATHYRSFVVGSFSASVALSLFACGGSTDSPVLSFDAGSLAVDASVDDRADTSTSHEPDANGARDGARDDVDPSLPDPTEGGRERIDDASGDRSIDPSADGDRIDANDAGCPATKPVTGASCVGTGRFCVYGNICCDGGRQCSPAGTWQPIPIGCACVLPDDAASTTTLCGAQTCSANEVCVHPSTSIGGAVPPCVAPADAGQCPQGTQYSSFCTGSVNGGCIAAYDPGPPSCAPIPGSCGNPLTCSCFPPAVCGGNANMCTSVTGHDLRCANFAP